MVACDNIDFKEKYTTSATDKDEANKQMIIYQTV